MGNSTVGGFLKDNILGILIFSIITGVLGNYTYDYIKNKYPTSTPLTPEDDEGLGCEPGLEVEIDKNSPESKLSNSFEIEYRQGKSYNLAQLPERLKPLLSFSEGLIKTQDVKYRKWGFLDKRGRIVVEFQYSDVGIFKEELAPFRSAPNELWGYINRTGQPAIPQKFIAASNFSEGLARVRDPNSKKCGYIDSKGTLKIPFKFVLARDFSDGLAAVKTKEDKRRTGYFYDVEGKKRDVSALPLPPYENNEYWSFIDKLGNIVISTTYTTVSDFHCGRAQVKNEKNEIGFIDQKGNLVIPFKKGFANDFSEDVALFRDDSNGGGHYYIDKTGKPLYQLKFEFAYSFSEGLAPVQLEKSGKWGYIDKNGKVAIDYQFAHAKCFFQGLAVVQSFYDKTWGVIDKTGAYVVPSQFDVLSDPNQGLLFETAGREKLTFNIIEVISNNLNDN